MNKTNLCLGFISLLVFKNMNLHKYPRCRKCIKQCNIIIIYIKQCIKQLNISIDMTCLK